MPDRLDNFKMLRRLDIDAVLEPEFRTRVDQDGPLTQQRRTWRALKARSLVNRMLAYDWKYTLADNDLPKVRFATDVAGVAVNYPFLGRQLADFSLSLPPEWKVKGLTLRWFFKKALRDFLPREILRKKKHGFGLPFGPWVLSHPRLREFATDSLHGVGRRGIVRSQFVSELLTKRLAEAPGYYGEMVWLLMMLEQWLRVYGSSRAPDGFGDLRGTSRD
jgi:asparagine synthase (glutamine-hydrolysing)